MNRVLFVDDDTAVLDGLHDSLRGSRRTWRMQFASSARVALDLLDHEPADVVVTDFAMPGMDGVELLEEVRRHWPDAVRLMCTAPTDEHDMLRIATVAHQVVTKPYEIAQMAAVVERALRLHERLDGDSVRRHVTSLGSLPSAPAAVRDVLALIDSGTGDAQSLAEVVEGDIGLTSKLLQLVNSSFYAARSRITSVEAAIVRLGLRTVRAIAMHENIDRAMSGHGDLDAAWLATMNRHSFAAADLAARIAPPALREDAFCAGLLHECGQLALAACRPDDYEEFMSPAGDAAETVAERERAVIGVTHGQVGAYLLSLWGFPIEIVDAVSTHADTGAEGIDDTAGLGAVVRLAHAVVEREQVAVCGAPDDEIVQRWLADIPGAAEAISTWRDCHDAA